MSPARPGPGGSTAGAVGGSSIVECIAEPFDLAATLQLRHLARGTSLTSRTLLRPLHNGGLARLSLLEAATGVSKPVITHLVGRMEREGLVIRSVDPADGRVTLVEITDAGRALHKEQRQWQRTRMAEVLDALSPEDELALGLAILWLPLLFASEGAECGDAKTSG